jgi:hypothetical protein
MSSRGKQTQGRAVARWSAEAWREFRCFTVSKLQRSEGRFELWQGWQLGWAGRGEVTGREGLCSELKPRQDRTGPRCTSDGRGVLWQWFKRVRNGEEETEEERRGYNRWREWMEWIGMNRDYSVWIM